ncbi:MAG TPA: TIGR03086 family metal-binding protein [Acidimicrobiales bacterium]|nr:TIGR03086 family metal-binding protein [Acidimicrobiales bacterium]
MSEMAERYRKIAGEFTQRVEAVPADAWDRPAPCEGWVARDVVRHLVEWGPSVLFENWNIERPETPPVDDDPAGAWRPINETLQRALDDPAVATSERDTQMGTNTLENVTDMIFTSDVLVHTWDLARATGQDESLDAEAVSRMYAGMEPMDEVLRSSGHFGPRTDVADDADLQTKLIAFTGRNPNWKP